ncbi:MAG: YbaN family protein [Alphaproteobacteria bacterium]|nr:YbaN family protein [Alphaproteobacteria bacterium]
MRANRPFLRLLFAPLGFVCLALGVVGAFLPLMPSTVFFISAAACFAYASPRLEAWLLSFDFIARPVRAWRERGAIARPAKLLATLGMSIGLLASALAGASLLMLAVAAFVLALCALFIWTRPD